LTEQDGAGAELGTVQQQIRVEHQRAAAALAKLEHFAEAGPVSRTGWVAAALEDLRRRLDAMPVLAKLQEFDVQCGTSDGEFRRPVRALSADDALHEVVQVVRFELNNDALVVRWARVFPAVPVEGAAPSPAAEE